MKKKKLPLLYWLDNEKNSTLIYKGKKIFKIIEFVDTIEKKKWWGVPIRFYGLEQIANQNREFKTRDSCKRYVQKLLETFCSDLFARKAEVEKLSK